MRGLTGVRNGCKMAPMQQPKHKTIKVRFATYRSLRKLAADAPETMTALIDRLVQEEIERRKIDQPASGA